ncbi:MAG: gamma carbonic anhydrase family protein [Candidatus Obscuribacterales bacterium]|jgi:carbonic anhydrase/acetyltransferase-like protein (isoleucine patch superfamily)
MKQYPYIIKYMNTLYKYAGFCPVVHESAFIAPTACLIGNVTVAEDASIWFHTVARGDINAISIGRSTNIQDGCLMHVTHHLGLTVGDRVTVGHGAILHGCTIESDCLIAMGAIILDGAKIGAHSIVAAGSIVAPNSQIPPGSLVMGVPGKVVREANAKDREMIERGAANYVGYKETYKESLSEL